MDTVIVSADDHLDMHTLPSDLWTARLPARYQDHAPRVVEVNGGKQWQIDGAALGPSGSLGWLDGKAAGPDDDGRRPSTPSLRLEDMDLDGVHTHVMYGPLRWPIPDPDLKFAVLAAYNDWAAEFNAASPERLCALGYLPSHDGEAAANELRRLASMGVRGALLNFFDWVRTDPFDHAYVRGWAPLWEAADETGIPVSVHLGGGTERLRVELGSWVTSAYTSICQMQMDEALTIMVFSGALAENPGFNLVLGESGIGWLPYVVQRMDQVQEKHGFRVNDFKLQEKPSDLFRRQVYATFEDDWVGVKMLDDIGAGNVMWASDYPHGDGVFPHSREAVAELEAIVGPETARKVTRDNAARLYKIDVPGV